VWGCVGGAHLLRHAKRTFEAHAVTTPVKPLNGVHQPARASELHSHFALLHFRTNSTPMINVKERSSEIELLVHSLINTHLLNVFECGCPGHPPPLQALELSQAQRGAVQDRMHITKQTPRCPPAAAASSYRNAHHFFKASHAPTLFDVLECH
jgi:hypothetical protein